MQAVPLDRHIIAAIIAELGIDVPKASIREMDNLVNTIQQRFDMEFILM